MCKYVENPNATPMSATTENTETTTDQSATTDTSTQSTDTNTQSQGQSS